MVQVYRRRETIRSCDIGIEHKGSKFGKTTFPNPSAIVFAATKRLKSLGSLESRSLFLPTFFVFGQLIGEFDPTELAARPCVVPWRQPVWFIKAARRDVDFVKEVFVLEGQLRAALRTETPRAFCRRPKPGGLTAHKPELSPRHAEPRDERSARGSTADRAVAVCLMKGRAGCLVTDPPAKASAFQHCISLLDHDTSVKGVRIALID